MFSCEYCKIYKNIYFEEYLRTAAPKWIYLDLIIAMFKRYLFGLKLWRN